MNFLSARRPELMAVNCADACRHTPTLNTGFLPCVLLSPIARSLSLADKSEFKLPWSHSDPPRILEKSPQALLSGFVHLFPTTEVSSVCLTECWLSGVLDGETAAGPSKPQSQTVTGLCPRDTTQKPHDLRKVP